MAHAPVPVNQAPRVADRPRDAQALLTLHVRGSKVSALCRAKREPDPGGDTGKTCLTGILTQRRIPGGRDARVEGFFSAHVLTQGVVDAAQVDKGRHAEPWIAQRLGSLQRAL